MADDSEHRPGSNQSDTGGTEETSLFDIGAIRAERSDLLGVEVDVLTPDARPDRWRDDVLARARAV